MRLALKSALLAVGLLGAGILSGCEPYEYGRDGYYRHYDRRYDNDRDGYYRHEGDRERRRSCDSDGDDCR